MRCPSDAAADAAADAADVFVFILVVDALLRGEVVLLVAGSVGEASSPKKSSTKTATSGVRSLRPCMRCGVKRLPTSNGLIFITSHK